MESTCLRVLLLSPDSDKGYLLIGFEDLWKGGNQDCNDTVFVVD